jgi:CheY-like chemotaxis protein
MAATRILVVDDDELLREFYSRVLKTRGYEPVCATNGDEALAILDKAETPFALAIVDLLMPVRTGWDLIQDIKARDAYKAMPIIAITGMSGSTEERQKVKTLCDEILLKSDFYLKKFLGTVERLLTKPA